MSLIVLVFMDLHRQVMPTAKEQQRILQYRIQFLHHQHIRQSAQKLQGQLLREGMGSGNLQRPYRVPGIRQYLPHIGGGHAPGQDSQLRIGPPLQPIISKIRENIPQDLLLPDDADMVLIGKPGENDPFLILYEALNLMVTNARAPV